MLPKKFRVTVSQFQKNKNLSQRQESFLFNLSIKNSSKDCPRFVIVVPKSLDKRSFYRHQSKRIIIEAIRNVLDKSKRTVDVLIKAKKIIRKKERTLVENQLNKLFKKEGLM